MEEGRMKQLEAALLKAAIITSVVGVAYIIAVVLIHAL